MILPSNGTGGGGRQKRSANRLVFIDDNVMMDALGAAEGVEGDQGNYYYAYLHDEFELFNTTWEDGAPGGMGAHILVVVRLFPSPGAL